MDVNDLGNQAVSTDILKDATQSAKAKAASPAVSPPKPELPPEVSIELSEANQVQTTDLRTRANQVINVVNVTTTATEDIQKLVESISGIVEQAQSLNLSPAKISILEKEANQLVEEIKSKALSTESNGVRPLMGDNVRFEVEQRVGYALDIILPDTAREAFGLGQINLSLKDSIIDTITRVEQAKQQFEKLRSSVDSAGESVKKIVDTFEVALQNSEASKTTIRSLDDALAVASNAHQLIGKNTEEALGSFSKLDLKATALLRS